MNGPTRMHPLGVVGLVALLAGVAAAVWLADWRWAVTGLLAFLLASVIGATLDSRRNHR